MTQMRFYRNFLFILLFCLPMLVAAQKDIGTSPIGNRKSGLRKAFLLGNKYYEMGPLENTERDVDSMSETLGKLGFVVTAFKNKSLRETQRAIEKFVSELTRDNTEIVVFYFSGHGLGYGETNYLLPIDTRLDCLDQLKSYGDVSLNRIVERILERRINHNYFFVDACRNLPWQLTHCDGSPGTSRGGMVKPLNNYKGAVISFATRPGDTADDNLVDQTNSLFTSELIKYLPTPDITMMRMIELVKEGVHLRSGGAQSPQRWDDILTNYTLVPTGRQPVLISAERPQPSGRKAMSVIAYKPGGKELDFEVVQMALKSLKMKFPDYEVRQKAGGKAIADGTILCTITRSTLARQVPLLVDGKTWEPISANTDLNLKFTQGDELVSEVEVSSMGIDHDKRTAIRISIEDSLKKIGDLIIDLE